MGHRARIAYWALAAMAVIAVVWTAVSMPPWPAKRSIKQPRGTTDVMTRAPIIDPAAIRAAVARHPLVAEGLKPGARAFVDGRWPLQSTIKLAVPVTVPSGSPTDPKGLELWSTIHRPPTEWTR